ncbi:MAG TPA: type II secretion system protein [Burkholderiales bacterium]|nr:type II secretion system protein [Burkholderiales bacterium]
MTRQRAFTLVEMAVVLAIVGFLLLMGMYTLTAQSEQRAREETQRRLELAQEALLGFAVANGRLPCPASSASSGAEALTAGNCSNPYDGFLPAVTLGFQPVDSDGFALDAWNNRIRYAVAAQNVVSCLGTPTQPHFTNKTNLKQNGMSCQPNTSDLIICKSSVAVPAPTAGNCQGGGANSVTNQGVLVAVIFSGGKNYALAPSAAAATAAGKFDEAENLDGDTVFITHTPAPQGATGGEYDDMMVWISVGQLYGRLSSAGVLP